MTRQAQLLKGEAQITAWSAMGRPAPGTLTDPGAIAMNLMMMSYLRAGAYTDMLRRQVKARDEEITARGAEAAAAVDGVSVDGLVGRKVAATSAGEIYETGEEVIRSLVTLEAQERDRAMDFAVKCHKMGIETRMTALAEAWGDVVAQQVSAMLAELQLTAEQEARVPMLVQSYLGSIEIGGIGR